MLIATIKDRTSNSQKENEAALGGIHNLASEARNRSLMHKLGVLSALFECLDDVGEHPNLVYIAVRTLHRLCVDEGVQYDIAKRNRLDTVVDLIQAGTSSEKLKGSSGLRFDAMTKNLIFHVARGRCCDAACNRPGQVSRRCSRNSQGRCSSKCTYDGYWQLRECQLEGFSELHYVLSES